MVMPVLFAIHAYVICGVALKISSNYLWFLLKAHRSKGKRAVDTFQFRPTRWVEVKAFRGVPLMMPTGPIRHSWSVATQPDHSHPLYNTLPESHTSGDFWASKSKTGLGKPFQPSESKHQKESISVAYFLWTPMVPVCYITRGGSHGRPRITIRCESP